jgi:Transposase DDE domain/Transposase DNA-binding
VDTADRAAELPPFDLDALFEHAPYNRALRKRLGKVLRALAAQPEASFPAALGPAGYRAATRLWQNPRVQERLPFDEVFDASAARLPEGQDVVVAHDTTDFLFPALAEREGLEPMAGGKARFRGHLSLAVGSGSERAVFGPLAFEPIARSAPVAAGQSARQRYDAPDKESLRWLRGIEAAEARAAGRARLVHVADREADDYATLATMAARGWRYVQRLRQSRVLAEPPDQAPHAHDVAEALAAGGPRLAERIVPLSLRPGPTKKTTPELRKRFPPRQERPARLEVRACSLVVKRPAQAPDTLPPSVRLNVVHVVEPAPPEGEPAVEWVLYTSEPVSTEAEVLRVVDWYRRRWLVEEFFKALKTGCAYESRQLESLEALLVALALFLPIATDLLSLRAAAEGAGETPADAVLSDAEVELLAAEAGCAPEALTVAEALKRVARLGGHLSHNGRPGWQVLWRGLRRLRERAEGWRAAQAALASAQGKKVTNA